MTTSKAYLDAIRGVLDHLQTSQMEGVERAAALIVDSLRRRGRIFCAPIGHGNEQDFINRAGGLLAVRLFSRPPAAKQREGAEALKKDEADLDAVREAVRENGVKEGDVVLMGSVSGRNRFPVELALSARAAGAKTIAFTSLAYTRKVTSAHPSGKRLFEVADVVLDNGAPYGDAAVSIPGFEQDMLPVSGVAMTVAGWMIWGRVMERMAAEGDPPSVYISVNRPDGPAWKEKAKADFEKRGY